MSMIRRRTLLISALAMLAMAPACAQEARPALSGPGWEVVARYPHDPKAFTQGLVWHEGTLYESTGHYGRSELRQVQLADGKVLRSAPMDRNVFGEGIVLWGDKVISLSWQNGMGFVWRRADFVPISTFSYPGEGWGLAQDGKQLIMSDGTAELRMLDPESFAETRRVTVRWQDYAVNMLNELEYVDNHVLANVWMSDLIARIDPTTGDINGWLNLAPLRRDAGVSNPDAVLNGIAWDAQNKRLFVTGKLWPWLYEVRLTGNWATTPD